MTIKKIFSLAASIINLFILTIFFTFNSSAENNTKRYSKDEGVLSIMYHRFNESKYPSTNIQMTVFKKHMELIKSSDFEIYNPKDFEKNFDKPKKRKKNTYNNR